MSLIGFQYTVTWGDFKKVVQRPVNATEDAKMHWLLGFKNVKHSRDKAVIISSVDVYIEIYKEDSWVLEDKQVASLLAHEQGHYDIVTIQGREFYKKLLSLKAKSVEDLRLKTADLHEKSRAAIEAVQTRYDAQTGRSQIIDIQQNWLKKIDITRKNPNGTLDDLPQ